MNFRRVSLLLIVVSGIAAAKNQYAGIPFASYEAYEALVNYAGEQNYAELSKCVTLLAPLFRSVRQATGEDTEGEIRKAIEDKDASRAQKSVLKLIFLDMDLNLEDAAQASDESERKQYIQKAFSNYGFLSTAVSQEHKSLDQGIRQAFKEMFHADDRSPIATQVKGLIGKISTGLGETNNHGTTPFK